MKSTIMNNLAHRNSKMSLEIEINDSMTIDYPFTNRNIDQ